MHDPDTALDMLSAILCDIWDRLRHDPDALVRFQELLLFAAAEQAQELRISRELWLDTAIRQWADAEFGIRTMRALLKIEQPSKPKGT